MADLDRIALVVVDVQRAFDDAAYWGTRNNPGLRGQRRRADRRLALARGARSCSSGTTPTERGSPLRPGQPGNAFKAVRRRAAPDLLVSKSVNSSFHGTPDLDAWLRERDLDGVVICGITTNHCCETTARVGGNLGHDGPVRARRDAHVRPHGPRRRRVTADELARATATSLHGEFATVVRTDRSSVG